MLIDIRLLKSRRLFNLLVATLIISILCTGCAGLNKPKSCDTNFGLTLETFNCPFKLPDTKSIIDIADGLLEHNLTVYYDMDSMPYDFDELDWNVLYTDAPATFQLYLQCLNPIVYLTKAYELTNDKKYLKKAETFLLSWNEYRKDEELIKNNTMVWYDHGTALRAENIIYYALVADNVGELNVNTCTLIIELLKLHGEKLSSDIFYTENHNHGIFQDRALIYIAYFLDDFNKENWISIAKERLKEQMNFAFTREGVHVENSPGYQIGVTDLFRVIADFLIQYEDEYGKELYEEIEQSMEFMTYITKPNGAAAAIGDTNDLVNGSTISNVNANVFENNNYTYAATLGQEGDMPEVKSVIYPESGYYISHNSWSKENYINSTWTMFKSGYSSKTHKHADDNSFMLYSKGFDIFVDPGWYNYSSGNRYRDYLISSLAHNTVIVDGKTYSPTVENSFKTGIFNYGIENDYDYVAGFNDMYNGVKIDRYFYNLGDALIIYDNVQSNDEHVYSQLFHTAEHMELVNHTKKEVLFKLGETDYYVRIKQFMDVENSKVIRGDFDKETYGYISRQMNSIEATNTVKFDSVGANVNFVTLITIEDKDGNIDDISNIAFNQNDMFFYIDKYNSEYKISLQERKRLSVDKIIVKQDNNTFTFENLCKDDNFLYAWYVIDMENNEALKKSEYCQSNKFSYEFKEKGTYLIRAYVKNSNNQRIYKTVAVITYDDDEQRFIDISSNYSYMNLIYNGHSYENIEGNKFVFNVDYNYSLASKIKWYIYKDGSYYDSILNENETMLEYEFTLPGDYTIMYYLTTEQGNNEFWNFPIITIK